MPHEAQHQDNETLFQRLGFNTVRSRISGTIILIVTLAMIIMGFLLTYVQYNEVNSAINRHLDHSEEEVRQFEDRAMQSGNVTANTTTEDFIRAFMHQQIPVENEAIAGFFEGEPPIFHIEGYGMDISQDMELRRQIQPLVTSDGTVWEDIEGETSYRVLVMPIVVNEANPGAIVFVHDIDSEMVEVWTLLRNFTIIALLTVVAAGFAAWGVSGQIMKPLTRLRTLAEDISEHNLDERLPIEGTSDLASVSRSFNSMVDRLGSAFASQYRLLDDAGHELRTPVTIVQGHLELMDVNDPADVTETRDLALAELDRMRRLTDDLVLLAKTERPDFLRLELTDISDVTIDAYQHAQQLANRDWELGEVANVIIKADPQRLLQAYLQLAANAVKFSDEGSKIIISSSVHYTRHGQELYLTVQDHGVGIAREDRARVFERFQRVDSKKEGAGLGLSIVAGIANAHKGDVALSSELGVGSSFSVVLPIGFDLEEVLGQEQDEEV